VSIRLIVSDVDGTILPRGGEISERTRAAVVVCGEAGIPFVICSGRWYVSAKVIAEALRLTEGYMIVANGGAIVRVDGSIVHEWRTPTEEAWRAYRMLQKYDVMRNAFTRDGVYRVNLQALKRKKSGLSGELGDRYKIVEEDVEAFEREGLENPYKLEAYSSDFEMMEALRAELRAAGFSVTSGYWDGAEIMAAGFGKGVALTWLAEHLGVKREEIMAFGDNTNDQSMLDAAGWPVAVGNAVGSLKASARLVAENCEDDGVAKMIERALRGELE